MNPLACQLNDELARDADDVFGMLSTLGRELYYPKGILTQSAEAKLKAHRHDATVGTAKENGRAMHLPGIMRRFAGLSPDDVLPYAPSPGVPALREKWRDHIREANPSLAGRDISLPLVTTGVTHGLSLVADLFADAGDTLLLPDMLWGNYLMIFGVRRGVRAVRYRLFSENGGLDTRGISRTIAEESKRGKLLVLLNFPNNPAGYAPTESEADALCLPLIAAAKDGCRVVVICDDAYFGLFYEPEVMAESIFARLAGRHPRLLALKLDGATKENFVWGLRVGFLTFGACGGAAVHDALEKKAAGCIRATVSNGPLASQTIVLKAMSDPDYAEAKKHKFEILRARAARVKAVLAQERYASAWTPYPFNSGYFMCLRLKRLNAEAFRIRLLEQYGIGVIATAPTDVRVAYSCIEEDAIADVFEQMFLCADTMAADPGNTAAAADGAPEE